MQKGINTKALMHRMIDYELTTAELADRIGMTPAYVKHVLEGRRALTLGVADKIQDALEIPNERFGYYFLEGSRSM